MNPQMKTPAGAGVTTRIATAVLLTVFAIFAVAPLQAMAHRGDQSYLYLDVGNGLSGRLQMPFLDVREALGIDLEAGDGAETEAKVAENAQALREYALRSVEIGDENGPWAISAGEVDRAGDDLDYVQVRLEIDHPDGDFRSFTMRLDPFFDEVDDRDALLLIASDLEGGVIENESEHLVRFTPDSRTQFVDLGEASQWSNFTSSISAGVDHIGTGPDHILFILALLVPSVLVWRGAWRPASRFGATLWRITKIMTMFTLAHSITFTLAGIGVLPSPGAKVTESVIALSIVATALHSLRPVVAEREWLIAFVFGLFHGFGFASLVNELDVSTGTQLVSLLGRNVGIEIGQLAVVLLLFPALFLLRTTRYYPWFLRLSSIALSIVALLWMFERVFEQRVRGLRFLENQLEYPRGLIFVAIFTAVAVGLRLLDDRAGTDETDESEAPKPAAEFADVVG